MVTLFIFFYEFILHSSVCTVMSISQSNYMVWMGSIFSWWTHFTVSPPNNSISALKRQHWPITNMSESSNIQGLNKSFENFNYSYASHTTCIEHLSPSSLCYPWSPSYHPSNHITVYLVFTSHMLYHHPSCHMLLVHSFRVSKPSQHTLINSTCRHSFHFSSSSHPFIPLFM